MSQSLHTLSVSVPCWGKRKQSWAWSELEAALSTASTNDLWYTYITYVNDTILNVRFWKPVVNDFKQHTCSGSLTSSQISQWLQLSLPWLQWVAIFFTHQYTIYSFTKAKSRQYSQNGYNIFWVWGTTVHVHVQYLVTTSQWVAWGQTLMRRQS